MWQACTMSCTLWQAAWPGCSPCCLLSTVPVRTSRMHQPDARKQTQGLVAALCSLKPVRQGCRSLCRHALSCLPAKSKSASLDRQWSVSVHAPLSGVAKPHLDCSHCSAM